MDVLDKLIGEKEILCFKENDFLALKGVLNDALSQSIKKYMENPQANQEAVAKLKKYLGNTIECYTMHFVLRDKGILDLVSNLTPAALVDSNTDLDYLIEQLSFLESNSSKLMTNIPTRTKSDWDFFILQMKMVDTYPELAAIGKTYPDWIQRIEANRMAFYIPNAKATSTRSGCVNSKHNQWTIALKGARYLKYCNENGIAQGARRVF